MDVDDDEEYMNAATAHAAFLMTVSEVRMYWLLRHAQHVRDINIHKLHPLPEQNRLGLCGFSAQWNQLHGPVRSIIYFLPISVRIFQNDSSTARSEKFNHDFKYLHSGTPLLLIKLCAEWFSLVFRIDFGLCRKYGNYRSDIATVLRSDRPGVKVTRKLAEASLTFLIAFLAFCPCSFLPAISSRAFSVFAIGVSVRHRVITMFFRPN